MKFVLPSGYSFSPQNQGSDDSVDSDADTSTGCTGGITLSAGQNDTTWDAGMFPAPSVGVEKFVPEQDSVTNNIVLVGSTVEFKVVITNTGNITMAYIPLHDEYDPTCLQYSPKAANPQENLRGSGYIDWNDLTVSFLHDLAPGETFTVTIPFYAQAPDDDAWNTASVHNAEDVNNNVAPDAQSTASVVCKLPASIGDRVWNDANGNATQDAGESGINGVTVRLYRDDGDSTFEPGTDDVLVATQTTSGDGDYDFTMLYAGSYWVDVDESTLASGYELTTANEPMLVTVNYGDDFNDADFGYAGRGDISGIVWYDWDEDGSQEPGEDGISGVTVDLYEDSDCDHSADSSTPISSTVTASDGSYVFHDFMPGCYIVEETDPTGYQSTTPNTRYVQLVVYGPSGSAVDNDFGDANFAQLGDFAYVDTNGNGQQDSGENTGLANVPITVTGHTVTGVDVVITTTTDANGNYLVEHLVPGTYTVTVGSTAGYQLTSPNPQTTTLEPGESDLDVDFGFISPTAVQLSSLTAESAAGPRVVLKWSTVSEEGNDGFVILRSLKAKGPWSEIGRVPGVAVGGGGADYQFVDEKVKAGKTYWYRPGATKAHSW